MSHIIKKIIIFILIVTQITISLNVIAFKGNIKTEESTNNINFLWKKTVGDQNGNQPGGFGVLSNVATRAMGIYDNELYVGTQNFALLNINSLFLKILASVLVFAYRLLEPTILSFLGARLLNLLIPLASFLNDGCELWKYNYTIDTWIPLVSNSASAILSPGFGDERNFVSSTITPFKGKLYFGTGKSSFVGCEIWEYDGQNLVKVVDKGFGNRFNSGAWSAIVYNDELWVGTMNWKQGSQIWKTYNGKDWEQVTLPGGNGFGSRLTNYIWAFCEYNSSLYVGTMNFNGCQIWSFKEDQWKKVELPGGDGFGEDQNIGVRNMVEYNDELWVTIASDFLLDIGACEIWKYDGYNWINVVGEEGIFRDGFNDIYNKYGWSMMVDSDNSLWIGTVSLQVFKDGFPGTSRGCELWRLKDGQWTEIVGNSTNSEIGNGFNDQTNVGARSIIEYPDGSGQIWIGTLNLDIKNFKSYTGCEIWRRININ